MPKNKLVYLMNFLTDVKTTMFQMFAVSGLCTAGQVLCAALRWCGENARKDVSFIVM